VSAQNTPICAPQLSTSSWTPAGHEAVNEEIVAFLDSDWIDWIEGIRDNHA